MSDGPHRSLPMRPSWRRLAERADKRAWSAEDVGDAFCDAVRDDFKRDVTADFLIALNGIIGASRQYLMFAEHGADQLAELRAVTATSSFAESIVDYVEIALRRGRVGKEAWQEGLQRAFLERGSEGLRQVEEHYKRKASQKAAERVRDRLEEGLRSKNFQAISESLLKQHRTDVVTRSTTKDRSLDAGPVLGE